MELVAYLRLFRRWWWLIVIAAFLAGGAAYLTKSRQPDQYQAWVSISVGSFIESPDPQTSEISVGQQLARTYAVIAKYHNTLQAAIDAGNFPVTPGELSNALSTEIVSDTSLLILRITYTDPVLAADMANELARQLILNSPTNLTPDQQSQIELATEEITRLNAELSQMRTELSNIDAQIATTISPDQIDELREQRNLLVSQINQASSTLADFNATVANLQRRTNSLDIVQPARIPTSPIGSNALSQTILAALVGAALAVGVVLLIEYLDNTVKSPDEISHVLGLKTLAVIPQFGKKTNDYPRRLIAYFEPNSPVSEQYRMLRTNLVFSGNGTFRKTYVTTSPGPTEGKSVVSANLAATMAMAGFRVLLVDADLRRPRIQDIFSLENQVGLSTLLSIDPSQNAQASEDEVIQLLKDYVHSTVIPGLYVLTSGASPLNPTEVLGSAVMQVWNERFHQALDVDIVIYDSPPSLVVADSSILAASLDASILMVLQAGRTRLGAAVRLKEVIEQLDVNIAGVVLNAVKRRDRDYDSYQYYYYYK